MNQDVELTLKWRSRKPDNCCYVFYVIFSIFSVIPLPLSHVVARGPSPTPHPSRKAKFHQGSCPCALKTVCSFVIVFKVCEGLSYFSLIYLVHM